MNKQEKKEFKRDLQRVADKVEDIYKLSSLLTKYCEANKDSDDLYEVSLVTKIIKEKATEIAWDTYNITHKDVKPFSLEMFEGKIVEFVD